MREWRENREVEGRKNERQKISYIQKIVRGSKVKEEEKERVWEEKV